MSLDHILKFLLPKDQELFPVFAEFSQLLLTSSEQLVLLLSTEDLDQRVIITKQIKDIEHSGDKLSQGIYTYLNNMFITPFDREDIQKLASDLDDVLDSIYGVSLKLSLFKPQSINPAFKDMADMIHQATMEIQIAMSGLNSAGKNKNKILQSCIKINTIENKADDIYHNAISQLFETQTDPIELIKNKSIIETLEKCVDCTEDISDTIKGILLKMS